MRSRPAVFGVGTDWVQLAWRDAPAGAHVVQACDSRWQFETDGERTVAGYVCGLEPDRRYDLVVDGRDVVRARTLPRPAGRLLARVATVSDLHIGEKAFGFLPRLRSLAAANRAFETGHPVWTLRAAIDEITEWSPDLVVVKGDLGHRNIQHEYDVLAAELRRVRAPLLITRGNHDGGNHQGCDPAAALAHHGIDVGRPGQVQVRDLDAARIVVVDTVVAGEHGGTSARDQAAVVAAVEGHRGPCLVALHHQFMTLPVPYYLPVGIPMREGRRFLDVLDAAHPGAVVTSGHTHRNRTRRHRSLLVTEVGAPKDYPGVWAAYEMYEGGIVQTVRRITDPRTLAWSERARHVVLGAWGLWAPGRRSDRCVVQPV